MKRIVLIIFVAFVFVFTLFDVAEAVSVQKQFAGIISSVKARQVQVLENAGYSCVVPGTSIDVTPKGKRGIQPTSYLIPYGTISKTKHIPSTGQKIIGKYFGKTTVICTHPIGDVQTVQLDTIKIYGNSAR